MHAGQHVFEKTLMTRHVDKPHPAAAGQRHIGETEVDGHATALLFLQPVGVDLGQGLDERRLPMIDVAGGPDDEGRAAGLGHASAATTASRRASSSSGSTVRGSS